MSKNTAAPPSPHAALPPKKIEADSYTHQTLQTITHE
jgi:hypothetical protein